MSIREALASNQKDQQEINRIRKNYHEVPPVIDFHEFVKTVESRRSIRRFTQAPVPESVMRECLRLAHLAPNSSSLLPWEFYWVREPELKKKLVPICMSQPAASTAQEFVVCVARTDTWNRNAQLVLNQMQATAEPSASTVEYYRRILPMQLRASFYWLPFKWMIYNLAGLFKPMMRFPLGRSDLKIWAVKSTALACENLMLALRAAGYDSCPMEGFDERRLKKLLRLPRGAHIAMVIAAGCRDRGGVYGPRIRIPIEQFVFEV